MHIAAALTCVVTGAVAALSPKRPGRHPRLGTLYYRSLCGGRLRGLAVHGSLARHTSYRVSVQPTCNAVADRD